MIIKKVLKTLSLFSLIGGTTTILFWGGTSNNHHASNTILHQVNNNASKIKYSFKLANGIIIVLATKVLFQNKNTLNLSAIDIEYKSSNKILKITAENCIYSLEAAKLYLNNNVVVNSDEITVKTIEATIDLNKECIFGNSETEGYMKNLKFQCSGFIVNKKGKIDLKDMKTLVKHK